MKKIILLFVLFLSTITFAQKTVYVYNFSSYVVQVGEFNAKNAPIGSPPAWPKYKSNNASTINIPAGSTYTLSQTNNTYFPFYSPTSVPVINSWRRQVSSGAVWTTITSANLNNALAASQNFDFVKFQVGTNGSLGGGNLGLNYPPQIISTSWIADYSTSGNEAIIVISNYP